MTGRRHTVEARAKIAAAGTGRAHTEDSKAILSAKHKGKIISAEQRAKMSKARIGIPLSEEWKQKIAQSTTGRKPVMCVETGEVFASITAAARVLGVAESGVNAAVRRGGRCKGRHFIRA